jgi:hypothetical protein
MSQKKFNGYTYSWSQPYPNWTTWTLPKLDPYNEDMMDYVEEKVKAMDTYPDADQIIRQVFDGVRR